ncbi:regulatory protein LuxR [Gemmatirosa kalamazoonensis]|uniref:Regulatory protein LuxR n=1 Tax=Gemmatirosa kalamazoonensis TaxID=861299 RepID=W0RFS0_9BACT|nr:LuxR family transcriptional regulator [Gemmatirosa kalamazoonensis]AHG88218.1 regulatory protein LuxR [Gemmatirosa kalamazoonensis]
MSVAAGREAFERGAWATAYGAFTAADRDTPLAPNDIERLAVAARLVERDAEAVALMERAHGEYLSAGDVEGAARTAFWIGFTLLFQGEGARSSGWLGRAARLLDDAALDSVVRGHLRMAAAIRCIGARQLDDALAAFREAAAIGARFGDSTLVSFSRMGEGRVLIKQGQIPFGVALLDEVMVGATAGEIAPPSMGDLYCAVLDACHEIVDLRRAQEWTDALDAWCASHPELVAHRGECLVHRAEVLQIHGAWPVALEEARRACARLADRPGRRLAGSAYYRRAELHRLRGEFAEAEAAYREASTFGVSPQPGFALLRLMQGQPDAAAAAIRGTMTEARPNPTRARVLAACVEILLATHDVDAARGAASELAELACRLDAPYLLALADQAAGAVCLADGDAEAALAALRRARARWRELDAPYDAARAAELLATALATLGDDDTAALERDAARALFRQLGATADLARLDQRQPGVPLTSRELEVLRLVATGKTNRAIAEALAISEKTVARHVANIFLKLSLSTRAAATAYAYTHALL